jgi:hypothetical protein
MQQMKSPGFSIPSLRLVLVLLWSIENFGGLTLTKSFYIHYFKLLATLIAEGKAMTPEINEQAMAYYATIPVQKSKN